MESSEEPKAVKPASPPPGQQASNVHVYPDWAAMQAYYGPRMAVPPYYNSAVASGHVSHPYMWGPQPMVPPYGAPYAAIYAHGGVYANHGIPIAATPNEETPTKSSGSTDQGKMKIKGFDGLTMTIGSCNAESDGGGDKSTQSQSEETGGSSDGSNGNTSGAGQKGRKRRHEETPNTDGNGKMDNKDIEVKGAQEKWDASSTGGVRPVTTADMMNTSNPKEIPTTPPQACAIIPSEVWLQNEREMKKERRKQSNRESARRSRLRKQAEAEELAKRVDFLNAENMKLKSEINRLAENSVKVKLENSMLTDQLKKIQDGKREGLITKKQEKKRIPVSTENFLARVNKLGSVNRNDEGEEIYDSNQGGAKLHQLLDTSPRPDAVPAS